MPVASNTTPDRPDRLSGPKPFLGLALVAFCGGIIATVWTHEWLWLLTGVITLFALAGVEAAMSGSSDARRARREARQKPAEPAARRAAPADPRTLLGDAALACKKAGVGAEDARAIVHSAYGLPRMPNYGPRALPWPRS